MMSKVYLVGAGPGDRGLITIKGLECLKKADVIIYDRLVNKELLDYRKKECELFFVGKESSNHILPQNEINHKILEEAKQGKIVVRLKGGDPYVFGRGGEEAEILYDNDVDFEVVPGVTSAIGGLAYAGIPVTHRDYASSFHVVTGHSKYDDNLDINWPALAKEKGTVIFLMGIGNIKHITKMLIENGRDPNTPVAFVSWATKYDQKTVKSSLEKAYLLVEEKKVKSPALFVVGEVVALTKKLGFFEKRPLFGKSIAITRTRAKNSELRYKLENLGARVIEIPTIQIEGIEVEKEYLKKMIKNNDYIAFTSQHSVKYFFNALRKHRIDKRILADSKICSIGEATTSEIEEKDIYPDIIADNFYANSLADKIIDDIKINGNNRIMYPCSEIAPGDFEEKLNENGAVVHRLNIYSNKVNLAAKEEVINIFENDKIDYITFTSSSTFNNLVELIGKENIEKLKMIKKVSIGSITSKNMTYSGINPDLESDKANINSLVDIILSDVEKNF